MIIKQSLNTTFQTYSKHDWNENEFNFQPASNDYVMAMFSILG